MRSILYKSLYPVVLQETLLFYSIFLSIQQTEHFSFFTDFIVQWSSLLYSVKLGQDPESRKNRVIALRECSRTRDSDGKIRNAPKFKTSNLNPHRGLASSVEMSRSIPGVRTSLPGSLLLICVSFWSPCTIRCVRVFFSLILRYRSWDLCHAVESRTDAGVSAGTSGVASLKALKTRGTLWNIPAADTKGDDCKSSETAWLSPDGWKWTLSSIGGFIMYLLYSSYSWGKKVLCNKL